MKKNINKEDNNVYIDLLASITRFSYFSCEMILPEDIEDFFFEYGKGYKNEEEFFNNLNPLLETSDRVFYLTGTLVDTEYVKFINSFEGVPIESKKEFIKKDSLDLLIPVTIHFNNNEQFVTLYVVDIFKIKTRKRKKTELELQSELDDAIKDENYEQAVKIREKIKKLKK